MDYILDKKLKNKYLILRHGESEAFKSHLILSSVKNGINSFGLTKTGRRQIKDSIINFISKYNKKYLNENTIIYSSDFKRAKESSEIVSKMLKINKINFTKALRERNFGKFENTSDENYNKVWLWDKTFNDKDLDNMKVENVKYIHSRLFKLILQLETKYNGKNILFIGHGDPLQILITIFKNKLPNYHHKMKKLDLAEIRKLN